MAVACVVVGGSIGLAVEAREDGADCEALEALLSFLHWLWVVVKRHPVGVAEVVV